MPCSRKLPVEVAIREAGRRQVGIGNCEIERTTGTTPIYPLRSIGIHVELQQQANVPRRRLRLDGVEVVPLQQRWPAQ